MPMTAMAVGAIAAPVVGGIAGSISAAKDRAQQKKMIKQALRELNKLGVPPDLSGPLILKELQRVGTYTPELEEDLSDSVAESAMANVKEDEGLRRAQTEALGSLQKRAKVGLSAEDRSALNQIRNEVQRDAEAKRQQVLQQMQARGMGGSGAALVAQLQAGQDAQNLASQQADTTMAQAQQRALEALRSSGDMAGQMQQQQFGRQSDIARAIDERNRFLAENNIARQTRNVGAQNQAQLANLQEQQRIADYNAQMANTEQARRRDEQAKFFDRKASLASTRASARLGAAQQYAQQAQNTAQSFANIGTGVGSALAGLSAMNSGSGSSGVPFSAQGLRPDAAGGTTGASRSYLSSPDYFSSDENMKEKISYDDPEVQAFMDRITKKFIKE